MMGVRRSSDLGLLARCRQVLDPVKQEGRSLWIHHWMVVVGPSFDLIAYRARCTALFFNQLFSHVVCTRTCKRDRI